VRKTHLLCFHSSTVVHDVLFSPKLMYFICFKGDSNEEMYTVWHEILRDLIFANFTDLISFYSVFTPLLFINRLFQVYDKSNKIW